MPFLQRCGWRRYLNKIHTCHLLDLLEMLVHIVKILHGHPCMITTRHSRITLHVPEGLYGIILGNVHENFDLFRHLVQKTDCIVSPMCEFEFHSYCDIPKGACYRIEVPHIVNNSKVEGSIKVMSRDRYQECIEYAQKLEPGEMPPDYEYTYYRFRERNLEIFTPHFSQFVVYAQNRTFEEVTGKDPPHCCSKSVECMVFIKWCKHSNGDPFLEVSLHICSLHYEGNDYRQVRNRRS